MGTPITQTAAAAGRLPSPQSESHTMRKLEAECSEQVTHEESGDQEALG